MKKRIVFGIIIGIVAIVAFIAIINFLGCYNQTMTNILSDKYDDKEYMAEIDSVELSPALESTVSENELFIVKLAVLENDIGSENEEKLVPLIKKYGTSNTLIGYSYLNSELITWNDLEAFIKDIGSKSISTAIKNYEKSTSVYVPSKFKIGQLEEWIDKNGYSAADIAMLDKLSQMYGKNFNELMDKYEQGRTIGQIKSEFGIVNLSDNIEYMSISEEDVSSLSEKLSLNDARAKNVLTMLLRLGFNPESIDNLDVSNEYELFELVLRKKYEEDISE